MKPAAGRAGNISEVSNLKQRETEVMAYIRGVGLGVEGGLRLSPLLMDINMVNHNETQDTSLILKGVLTGAVDPH